MLLSVMCLFAHVAMAADYVFQEGENHFTEYQSVRATYTVKTDGKVLIETGEQGFTITNGNVTASPRQALNGGGYTTAYELDAKTGDVIRISIDFAMSGFLRITEMGNGPIPVKLIIITPTTDTTFTWNNTGMITAQFNKAVSASSIVLKWNGHTYDTDDIHLGSQFVSCNITNALNQAYSDGLTAGQPIQVVISGIADLDDPSNLFNGTGTLTINYIAPLQQGRLLSATFGGTAISEGGSGHTFLSYYDTAQSDGILTFEFSEDVKSISSIELSMGSADLISLGKYYNEPLFFDIQGNKVLVDLRGIDRSLSKMFPSIDIDAEKDNTDERSHIDLTRIFLNVKNVIDVNGNYMYSAGQGTVGSYSYVFNYKELTDEFMWDYEGLAEDDAVIENDRITLWLCEPVTVNSVTVNYYVIADVGEEGLIYEPASVSIPAASVSVTEDTYGDTYLSFVLPDMPGAAEEQRVSILISVNSASGMPHTIVPKFYYKEQPTSGIAQMPTDAALPSSAIYNLQGQRVSAGTKGMLIVNGKKLIVR